MNIDTIILQLNTYYDNHIRTNAPKANHAKVTANYLMLCKEFGRAYDGIHEEPGVKEIVNEIVTEAAMADVTSSQIIYCDGCCLGNGQVGARAGFGIYITDVSGASVLRESFRVPSCDSQTNQRAELLALRYALSYVSEHTDVEFIIYTDSRYAMDCITKWAIGWAASGWRKSDNKPVLHSDLIQDCLTMYTRVVDRLRLEHIASHTGRKDDASQGNAEADRLARAGAEL
jgi:ribonuclease HI